VSDPARTGLAGRDANRAAHAHPEHKPTRPLLAGRILPAPSSANAPPAAGDVPRDVRSGLRQGLREGLREGLRPRMEPSLPPEPARQAPGEGSAASADLRG
jgi:hypothetical protein